MRSDIFFLGCIFYHMLSGKPALEETRDRLPGMSRQSFRRDDADPEVTPDLPKDVVSIVNKATMIDPDPRYQSPGEMLSDLPWPTGAHGRRQWQASEQRHARKQRTLMIVEPNPQTQETLRDHFKDQGFRVLVTADPQRPASLFTDTKPSGRLRDLQHLRLGEEALEAFNDFGEQPATQVGAGHFALGRQARRLGQPQRKPTSVMPP